MEKRVNFQILSIDIFIDKISEMVFNQYGEIFRKIFWTIVGSTNIWLSQGNFNFKWLNEILKRINGRDR
jgi:hypothetical protein